MTTFLDELEIELDRAAGRIVAGRRRRGGAVLLVTIAAAVIAAGILWPRDAPVEREAKPAAPAEGYALPAPPPSLADVPITVASTPNSRSPDIEGQLQRAGWRIPHKLGRVPEAHKDLEGMVVVYGTAPRDQADLVARTLGIATVESADDPAFEELRDTPLSVVVGEHAIFPGAVDAYRARFSVLGPDGEGTADTARGPVRVYVSGADLCYFDPPGGTCGDYDGMVSGNNVLTTESEQGVIRRATGIVPDGVPYVIVNGERVPVRDNVWVHGPTDAGEVEIPGIGSTHIGPR